MKKIGIILLVALIAIQFFRPPVNKGSQDQPDDISKIYPMPSDVQNTLQVACYNCHSNNTDYPWYYNIQPVAWFMSSHINEGKHHLNFNEFKSYDVFEQASKLKHISSAVTKGWMPIDSYKWMHSEARLSEQQSKAVADWATGLRDKILADMSPEQKAKMKEKEQEQHHD